MTADQMFPPAGTMADAGRVSQPAMLEVDRDQASTCPACGGPAVGKLVGHCDSCRRLRACALSLPIDSPDLWT